MTGRIMAANRRGAPTRREIDATSPVDKYGVPIDARRISAVESGEMIDEAFIVMRAPDTPTDRKIAREPFGCVMEDL